MKSKFFADWKPLPVSAEAAVSFRAACRPGFLGLSARRESRGPACGSVPRSCPGPVPGRGCGEAEHGHVKVKQGCEGFDLKSVVVDQEAEIPQVPVLVERDGVQDDHVSKFSFEAHVPAERQRIGDAVPQEDLISRDKPGDLVREQPARGSYAALEIRQAVLDGPDALHPAGDSGRHEPGRRPMQASILRA